MHFTQIYSLESLFWSYVFFYLFLQNWFYGWKVIGLRSKIGSHRGRNGTCSCAGSVATSFEGTHIGIVTVCITIKTHDPRVNVKILLHFIQLSFWNFLFNAKCRFMTVTSTVMTNHGLLNIKWFYFLNKSLVVTRIWKIGYLF